jgi:hypothetical protein
MKMQRNFAADNGGNPIASPASPQRDRRLAQAKAIDIRPKQQGDSWHPPILRQGEETFEQFQATVRREWLQGSAISPEQADCSIDFLPEFESGPGGEISATPAHDVLGIPYRRFGRAATLPLFAAVYRNANGSVYQIRINQEWWDPRKGKYSKPYRFLAGSGARLYSPPIANESRLHPKIWLLTEGVKKAQAALTHGYRAFSLPGATAGHAAKDKLKPEFIPDLKVLAQQAIAAGAMICIAFDEDVHPETLRKVRAATAKLARLLVAEGCQVSIACWELEFRLNEKKSDRSTRERSLRRQC